MFIWEGIPAIIWAFLWWHLVKDRPHEAKWLDEEEKKTLEEVLQKEQNAIKPVKNYLTAFKSPTVVLLCLMYVLWSLGVYGFVIWLPSIIHAAPGVGIVKTGWLSAFPYLLAIIGMIVASHYSDKKLKRKIFIWPFLILGAIAFYLSYLVGTTNFWLSFSLLSIAGMAMYTPYGPFFAIITEILPANVAGVSLALINSFGALGAFAGSYMVGYLNGSTGGFGTSYVYMAGSLLLAAFLARFALKDAAP
jgi:sugar phosphate permease